MFPASRLRHPSSSVMASDVRTEFHNKNRSKVCALCLNEQGLKPSRPVTMNEADIIRSRIAQSFNLNDEKYTSVLCSTCHTQLWRLHHGSSNLIFLSKKFGEDLTPVTRLTSAEKCDCIICVRGQLNGGAWMKFKKEMKELKKKGDDVKDDHRLCPICLSKVY